ncbi:MAG: hypothetical protein QXG05_06730 [Nitrososphaerota archaeon]
MEPREKTRRWLPTLLSIVIVLIPLIILFALSSGANTASQTVQNNFTTDQQIIFNTFTGIAALLLLIFIPAYYLLYRREKRKELR